MIGSLNSVTDSMVLQTPADAKKRAQAEKHRARARAYYLRNREAVKERSLQRYYSAQEAQKEEPKREAEEGRIRAGRAAERDEKTEKYGIPRRNWGDVIGIGMIVGSAVWAAVYVDRELQKRAVASSEAKGVVSSDVSQDQHVTVVQPSALSERERNFAEIRRILAEAPYNHAA